MEGVMLVTWVTKLYFENGDKNIKILFCIAKQDQIVPFIFTVLNLYTCDGWKNEM